MKRVQLFIQPRCPFCVKALGYIKQLQAQHPELNNIVIEIHDEIQEADYADSYDYYYVPTMFIDDKKVHEGAIYESEMEALLRQAL